MLSRYAQVHLKTDLFVQVSNQSAFAPVRVYTGHRRVQDFTGRRDAKMSVDFSVDF
jgi:hypothetical protein